MVEMILRLVFFLTNDDVENICKRKASTELKESKRRQLKKRKAMNQLILATGEQTRSEEATNDVDKQKQKKNNVDRWVSFILPIQSTCRSLKRKVRVGEFLSWRLR